MKQVNSRISGFRVRRQPAARLAAHLNLQHGVDLVWIPSIADSVNRFGERFLKRVFLPQELQDSNGCHSTRLASLAARFAAKESVMKLLNVDPDTSFPWTAVEVVRSATGSPALRLHGVARQLADQAGWHSFCVSLSHDHEYAIASVLAQRADRIKQRI